MRDEQVQLTGPVAKAFMELVDKSREVWEQASSYTVKAQMQASFHLMDVLEEAFDDRGRTSEIRREKRPLGLDQPQTTELAELRTRIEALEEFAQLAIQDMTEPITMKHR